MFSVLVTLQLSNVCLHFFSFFYGFTDKNDHSFEKPQIEIAELRSVINMYREEKSNLSARVQQQ